MIICSRCGSNNDDSRASCFSCFAPLQGVAAAKVKPVNLVGKGMAVPDLIGLPEDDIGAPAVSTKPKKKGLFGKK